MNGLNIDKIDLAGHTVLDGSIPSESGAFALKIAAADFNGDGTQDIAFSVASKVQIFSPSPKTGFSSVGAR